MPKTLSSQVEHSDLANQQETSLVKKAFDNAESVSLADPYDEDPDGQSSDDMEFVHPLGHKKGKYYFIRLCGQLLDLPAEKLETGRGVRALFSGAPDEVKKKCREMFPDGNGEWCTKKAGQWIIEKCNIKGIFDPSNLDIRSVGVWRDEDDAAVAHCGDKLVYPDGTSLPPSKSRPPRIMIAAPSISKPDIRGLRPNVMNDVLHSLREGWGWNCDADADIWLGFVAMACLGGFP
ncbi:MAG: hypothetical protein QNJ09_03815 [Paracoccaceae bacterium]|nr:hypothetical protein [Paracoccaceae bacterium]